MLYICGGVSFYFIQVQEFLTVILLLLYINIL